MNRSIRVLVWTVLLTGLGWTLLLTLLFLWEIQNEDQRFAETLHLRAQILNQSTQALRNWVGSHGGVYVQVDDSVKPNPLLAGVPERDLQTPSGRQLTLYNSPALLRQIMDEFEAASGNRVRFSSLRPINPNNLADPWERGGLALLESGAKQVQALTEIDGRPFYRLMTPMVLGANCLNCHTHDPKQLGSVIGAVTVSLDAEPDFVAHRQAHHTMIASHLGIWGMGLLGLLVAGRQWWRMLTRLEQSASHDSLTGFFNRMELSQRLQSEMANADRYHNGLALIMFDIDHFKRINDSYGHPVGDEVLKTLGAIIGREIRRGDWMVRYGGEEFLLVCPHTEIEGAATVAERVRHAVMDARLQTRGGEIRITVSAGVTAYAPHVAMEALIKAADDALYEAKRTGRNRVCRMSPAAA